MSTFLLKPPKPPKAPKAEATASDETHADPSDRTAGRELTEREKRALINQIDGTERKLGYAAAILATVIALITFVPFIDNPKLTVQKTASVVRGHTCPAGGYHYQSSSHNCVANLAYSRGHWVIELVILLVFALAVFATTRIARRAALAFTTLMTGLAFMTEVTPILAFPFIFLGGWLLVRSWRVQRYGSPTAKGPAAGQRAQPRTRPAGAKGAPAKGRRGTQGSSGPPRPSASKRYTPKTPPRRKIPPPPDATR